GQCTCTLPSTDPHRYVVAAGSQHKLAGGTIVGLRHLAVTQRGGMLQIGYDASIPGGTDAIADQLRVLRGARVGRLFANTFFVDSEATVTNGGAFAGATPRVVAPRDAH